MEGNKLRIGDQRFPVIGTNERLPQANKGATLRWGVYALSAQAFTSITASVYQIANIVLGVNDKIVNVQQAFLTWTFFDSSQNNSYLIWDLGFIQCNNTISVDRASVNYLVTLPARTDLPVNLLVETDTSYQISFNIGVQATDILRYTGQTPAIGDTISAVLSFSYLS